MNPSFGRFLALGEAERRLLFTETAERIGTVPAYVEQDFWVCMTLDALYHGLPQGHPAFLFKGGTALSKSFGLIDRFSEDVDITVSREALGFAGDRDPTNPDSGLSNTKRARLFEELRASCSAYIQIDLRRELGAALDAAGAESAIHVDEADQSGQSLLVGYRSVLAGEGRPFYVQPRVKIEGGARGGLDMAVETAIDPFVAADIPDLPLEVGGIVTIHPARAFWEKLLILHGFHCGYRDEGRIPSAERISRHYYDTAMIAGTDIGKDAAGRLDVGKGAREHTLLAFRQRWKKIEEAVPGSLRLVPQPELRSAMERDYRRMQGMMAGDAPAFEWINDRLQALETQFNDPSSGPGAENLDSGFSGPS